MSVYVLHKQLKSRVTSLVFVYTTAGDDIDDGNQDGDEIPPIDGKKNKGRQFTNDVKKKCWEKTEKLAGRSGENWRVDHYGNPIYYHISGGSGAHVYQYDHIVPCQNHMIQVWRIIRHSNLW